MEHRCPFCADFEGNPGRRDVEDAPRPPPEGVAPDEYQDIIDAQEALEQARERGRDPDRTRRRVAQLTEEEAAGCDEWVKRQLAHEQANGIRDVADIEPILQFCDHPMSHLEAEIRASSSQATGVAGPGADACQLPSAMNAVYKKGLVPIKDEFRAVKGQWVRTVRLGSQKAHNPQNSSSASSAPGMPDVLSAVSEVPMVCGSCATFSNGQKGSLTECDVCGVATHPSAPCSTVLQLGDTWIQECRECSASRETRDLARHALSDPIASVVEDDGDGKRTAVPTCKYCKRKHATHSCLWKKLGFLPTAPLEHIIKELEARSRRGDHSLIPTVPVHAPVDYWIRKNGTWTRVHRQPRRALCDPFLIDGGPVGAGRTLTA